MTVSEFISIFDSISGKANEQRKLYAHMVLTPEATDEELMRALGISTKTSFKSIKQNLLKKGLKIEPIDH